MAGVNWSTACLDSHTGVIVATGYSAVELIGVPVAWDSAAPRGYWSMNGAERAIAAVDYAAPAAAVEVAYDV